MTIPGHGHHPSTCKQMPHSLDKTYLLGPYAGTKGGGGGGGFPSWGRGPQISRQ